MGKVISTKRAPASEGAQGRTAAGLAVAGCGQTLDAGRDVSPLPAGQRNPVIISNDSCTDNWGGEYTMLLANSGGPPLVGIVVNASRYWSDLDANASCWNSLVEAARQSGLKNIPDVTRSAGNPLAAPADGQIDSTVPNRSASGVRWWFWPGRNSPIWRTPT
jgi:hypothetical protein